MYTITAVSLSVLAGIAGLFVLYSSRAAARQAFRQRVATSLAERERVLVIADLQQVRNQARTAERERAQVSADLQLVRIQAEIAERERVKLAGELAHLRSQLARDGKRHFTDQMVWFFDDLAAILLDIKIELDIYAERVGVNQFYRYQTSRVETAIEAVRASRVHPCAYRPKTTAGRPERPGVTGWIRG